MKKAFLPDRVRLRRALLPATLGLLSLAAFGCSSLGAAPEPAAKAGEIAAPGSASAPSAKAPASDPAFARGDALYETGEYADAADAYESVYSSSPRGPRAEEALWKTAESSFRAAQYERAYEAYDKLLDRFPTTSHYPDALERIFQIGKLFVEGKAERPSFFLRISKKDPEYGIEVLERFISPRHHGGVDRSLSQVADRHPLAPEALFLVGQAHQDAHDPELAIESWDNLVKAYPQSSWARAAEYRIALAFLSISYGVDYDKRPLLTALRRLRSYARKYPTGDNVQEAEDAAARLEDDLSRHDLKIAKRYARDDHFFSAQIYLTAIRRDYPKTPAAQEAAALAKEWPDPPLPPPPDEAKK